MQLKRLLYPLFSLILLIHLVGSSLPSSANNSPQPKPVFKAFPLESIWGEYFKVGESESMTAKIKGLKYLIDKSKDNKEIINLKLKRSYAQLKLVRSLKKDSQSKAITSKRTDNIFDKALSDARAVINNKSSSKPQLGMAWFFSGLIFQQWGNDEKSIRDLSKSLDLNPQFNMAPYMALYIADTLFRLKKYQASIKYYRLSMSNKHKDSVHHAKHMLAWAHAQTGKFSQANNLLLPLIEKDFNGTVKYALINDLAYFSSQHLNKSDLVQLGKNNFGKNKNLHLAFLTQANKYSSFSSNDSDSWVLLEKIKQLKGNTDKTLSHLITRLRNERRSNNFIKLYKLQIEVKNFFQKNYIGPNSSQLKKIQPPLEATLLRSYRLLEQQAQTNKMKKENVTAHLLDLIEIYANHLKYTSLWPDAFKKWVNICKASKDSQCILKVSNLILSSENMRFLHGDAKAYISTQQAEAEKQNLGNDIEKYLAAKDFKNYEKSIEKFLSESSDAEKDKWTKKYLTYLNERGKWRKYLNIIMSLPVKKRILSEFSSFSKLASEHFIAMGDFSSSKQIYKNSITKLPQWADFHSLICDLSTTQISTPSLSLRLFKLVPSDRDYLLRILSLTNSEQVMQIYKNRFPKSQKEKEALLLAYQMYEEYPDVKLSPQVAKQIGNINRNLASKVTESKSARHSKSIIFPPSNLKGVQFNGALNRILSQTRENRKLVEADLTNSAPLARQDIIKSAILIEQKTANLILLGAGTNKNKKKLAQEFLNQVAHYKKLAKHYKSITKNKNTIAKSQLTGPQMSLWKWPKTKITSMIRRLISQKNIFAALVVLDINEQKSLIDSDSYFYLRAGSLLKTFPHAMTWKFVSQELTSNNQTQILNYWKGIIK